MFLYMPKYVDIYSYLNWKGYFYITELIFLSQVVNVKKLF